MQKVREISNKEELTRFFSYVPKREPGQCWIWKTKPYKTGYPVYALKNGVRVTASKTAYMYLVGAVPPGLFVCHRCDVRNCVNPTHLFLASHKDNMRDMVEKGRQATGDKHASRLYPEKRPRGSQHFMNLKPELRKFGSTNSASKLTESQVIEIRKLLAEGETVISLAKAFHVSKTNIRYIKNGKAWKHLL